MTIIWTILIGFIVGVIAKFITPGSNEPRGFILTTILGVAGAFLATYAGRYMGWYAPGQTAGFIGALIGAVVLLALWAVFARKAS
jgi:uncharacterized membrane protein YeaQ/YmgE (transglycosylase-associated protein family)